MPLDAPSGPVRFTSLEELLAERDIRPVDWRTLNAHKQAQLRRFGPSFWYRHQASLGVALIGSAGMMALTAGAAHTIVSSASPAAMWIATGWVCLMAAMIVCGTFRARSGSHWEERWVPAGRLEDVGVPAPITLLASSLQRVIPGSTLVLGELIRETAVLDPYLLLVRGEDRVCLGVWDDEGIIAQAR